MKTCWFLYRAGTQYSGNANDLRVWHLTEPETRFTVPKDAQEGDVFIFCLAAETEGFPSFTRYAEIAVHVKE